MPLHAGHTGRVVGPSTAAGVNQTPVAAYAAAAAAAAQGYVRRLRLSLSSLLFS